MMKKTLVAVAALAATSSFAQVTLTGRADMQYSTYGASGSAWANTDMATRSRVVDGGSRITFATNEDLGGGLKAGVYCESGLNIDKGAATGQSGLAASSTSEWCSREGRVFIGNNTAELRIGRQNNWWGQGELNDTGSNKVGVDVSSNVFNNHGSGTTSTLNTRFDNTIKVVGGSDLGQFAGSEVWMSIPSAYEQAANSLTPSDRGQIVNGFTIKYSLGNLVAQIDAVNANTITSATANTFDRTMQRYGVGYKYAPGSIISGQYYAKERTDKSNAAAAYRNVGDYGQALTVNTGSAKDSGYIINLNHVFTNEVILVAQYARGNNVTTGQAATELADSGLVGYTLGGMYRLSKRTHLFAATNSIQNGANSNANFTGGGQNSGTVTNGSTVTLTNIGIQHNF